MLIACNVQREKEQQIPAVIHTDGTCRVQTVREEDNYRFRKILEAFYEETGVPRVA